MIAAASASGYGLYGGQYAWPSAYGPGFSSTCYGCRIGKRSADAEPTLEDGQGVLIHPNGGRSFAATSIWVHKRSAEPTLEDGQGVALHPNGGRSFIGRTIWGLGKRSADAEPEADAKAEADANAEAVADAAADADAFFGYGGYGRGYGGYGKCSKFGGICLSLGQIFN